jgi:hypothetical protein
MTNSEYIKELILIGAAGLDSAERLYRLVPSADNKGRVAQGHDALDILFSKYAEAYATEWLDKLDSEISGITSDWYGEEI